MYRTTVFQIRTQALGHVLGQYLTEALAKEHLPKWEAHQKRLAGDTHVKTGEPHWLRIVPVSLYLASEEQAKALGLSAASHPCELPEPVGPSTESLQPFTASGVGRVD